MEIKQIELLGQTQTEKQKKQQQEKITRLMLNPTQDAEKELIGASSCQHLFKYVSPIEQEEALSRKHNQKLLDESLQRFAQQQQAHEQMLMRVQLKAMALHEAQKPTQQGNDKQQVNVDTGNGKVRKKLKPLEREANEGLLLIYEIFNYYKVEYLDELPAHKAWGKIISKEFNSDSLSSIAGSNKYITLSAGEKIKKQTFVINTEDDLNNYTTRSRH